MVDHLYNLFVGNSQVQADSRRQFHSTVYVTAVRSGGQCNVPCVVTCYWLVR